MKKNATIVPSAPQHHAAADRRHAAQRRFRRAAQPFLDVRRRNHELFARDPRQRADQRDLLEAHEDAAVELEIAAAHELHQRACLVHELEGQQGERRENREGCETRDHAGRDARLAAELVRQPAVGRVAAGRRGRSPRPSRRRRAAEPTPCRTPRGQRGRRRRLLCRTPRAPLGNETFVGCPYICGGRGGSIAGEEEVLGGLALHRARAGGGRR